MMPVFTHFIITRFNLKQTIWDADKLGQAVNDPSWLQARYDLFEQYCFSSMLHQSVQTYQWLVYFDVDTPDVFKEKNGLFAASHPNFIPKYVSNFKQFETELPLDIVQLLSKNSTHIITTRLDNDDCLHRDAVKIIQKHFVPQHMCMIDLVHGLTMQIEKPSKLALRRNVHSGPFISLIEQLSVEKQILTVYDREHSRWNGDVAFVNVKDGFYWLQIIHDRNIKNSLSSHYTFNSAYLKGYEFLKPVHFSFRYYIFILLKKLKRILKSMMTNLTSH